MGTTRRGYVTLVRWAWTPARERAAELVAADELTDEAIAAAVGVSRRTLTYWKRHPEFRARVAARQREARALWRREWLAELRRQRREQAARAAARRRGTGR